MMRRNLLSLLFAFLLFCTGAAPVEAQQYGENGNGNGAIGIMTGPATGTYIEFGKDIADIASREGVTLMVKESTGSIDNIKRISSAENAALGIVQSDVLGYLKRSKNPESMQLARHLRGVFPFYSEEVHVLARRNIKRFSDLNGARVVVGSEGSGSWLTSMNLLAMMEIEPRKLLRLSPPEGVLAVLRDRADAMIMVGGKPVKLFTNMEDLARMENISYRELLEGVHFLPLDDARMLKEYTASQLTSADYNYITETVPTVSVTSALVSYSFAEENNPYAHQRCNALGATAYAIREHLGYLQEHGHPKWREVKASGTVKGWETDPCVTSYKPKNAPSPAQDSLEQDLLNSIQKRW